MPTYDSKRGRINMSVVSDKVEPLTFTFEDDGIVPNNPMPFLVYKAAIDVANDHPEKTVEGLFGANGWGERWRNCVFDDLHAPADARHDIQRARDIVEGERVGLPHGWIPYLFQWYSG